MENNKQPIIIQGAMDMEVEELLKLVNIEKRKILKGLDFILWYFRWRKFQYVNELINKI